MFFVGMPVRNVYNMSDSSQTKYSTYYASFTSRNWELRKYGSRFCMTPKKIILGTAIGVGYVLPPKGT